VAPALSNSTSFSFLNFTSDINSSEAEKEPVIKRRRFRFINPEPVELNPEASASIKLSNQEEENLMARPDSSDSRITLKKRQAALRCLDRAIVYPTGYSTKDHLTQRNESLYSLLKRNRMCVIPDEKVRSIDNLPHFEFLESVRAGHHE
jgi:hypothetical protein